MRRVALVLALALPTALLGAAPSTAEDPISHTLPEYVVGPTDFEIRIAPDQPAICEMTYGGQARTSAPWTFRFDPAIRARLVKVTTCTAGSFDFYIAPVPDLAYFVSRTDEIREAGHKSKMFIINNVELPGRVQIADPTGKVLLRSPLQVQRSTPLTVTLPRIAKRLDYLSVTMTSDNGAYTVTDRIPVSRGWARVTSPLPIAPCSKIIWRYQSAGAPAGTSKVKVEADLRKAMDLVSQATGLSFAPAADQTEFLGAQHAITFSWRAMLGTAGAEAQMATTNDSRGARTRSQVWLNSLAAGMKDRFSGAASGKSGGTPGRVWPLTKALINNLGLEPTGEKGNLMVPNLVGPAALGAGDRFGLDYLYKSRCNSL